MLIYYSAQKVLNWFAFSTDENSETLESSAINDVIVNAINEVCNSRFLMDVIVRSNNNPVNDMTAPYYANKSLTIL